MSDVAPGTSPCAAKPWLALLGEVQRAPVTPPPTVLHAFRRPSTGPRAARPASGFKVRPREVEDVLRTHPAVREAAVVGAPDAYRGETVRACVSPRPEASVEPDELGVYCKERLAVYKYPRELVILTEPPKTASGKILRRELRSSR